MRIVSFLHLLQFALLYCNALQAVSETDNDLEETLDAEVDTSQQTVTVDAESEEEDGEGEGAPIHAKSQRVSSRLSTRDQNMGVEVSFNRMELAMLFSSSHLLMTSRCVDRVLT